MVLRPDEDGKPWLESGEWHFNLSHSGDWALLGVAREELGIDVEDSGRRVEHHPLAQRFFSRYEADRAHSKETFFQIWTLKEAYVKAVGKGLRLPLDDFRVIDDGGRWGVFSLAGQQLGHWEGTRLETRLSLPPDYYAALVTPAPVAGLRSFRYQPFVAPSL